MEGLNKAQCGALQSRLVITAVATLSGLFIKYASRLETRGLDRWVRVLQVDPVTGRPRGGRPLITVANHVSCLDDPLLMGALPWRTLLKASWTGRMRWTPGSRRICYANPLLGYFFGLGQVIPVSWGLGVFQEGMRIAQSRLERGDWVHIFPEGRVNQSGRIWPVKWGVGQLIMETKRKLGVSPIILSLAHTGTRRRLQLCAQLNRKRSWHAKRAFGRAAVASRVTGMENVLSEERVYIPLPCQRVQLAAGEPYDVDAVMAHHDALGSPDEVVRAHITDVVEMNLADLEHRLLFHPESLPPVD